MGLGTRSQQKYYICPIFQIAMVSYMYVQLEGNHLSNNIHKAMVIKLRDSLTHPNPLFDFQLTFLIFRSKVKTIK